MATQFTKETWRPGKRGNSRKRKRAWGGAVEAPPALLAMGRLVGLGSDAAKARRCRHCGRPAMRGLPVCVAHGGARWATARGDYQPKPHGSRASDRVPLGEPVT